MRGAESVPLRLGPCKAALRGLGEGLDGRDGGSPSDAQLRSILNPHKPITRLQLLV